MIAYLAITSAQVEGHVLLALRIPIGTTRLRNVLPALLALHLIRKLTNVWEYSLLSTILTQAPPRITIQAHLWPPNKAAKLSTNSSMADNACHACSQATGT